MEISYSWSSTGFSLWATSIFTLINIHTGDFSWRGPARPGKTQSFRINPPEFASRAEAPYSGRLRYYST
ncbi:hypothetical protein J6590_091219 [Homalodisca vitripennis]|nr:hypothetical protein J6590_091219 [Homalodisca vitripennis]